MAEIELVLVVVVILIPMLLLIRGFWSYSGPFLELAFEVENGAYRQVVGGGAVNTAQTVVPAMEPTLQGEGLPNRLDFAVTDSAVTANMGVLGSNDAGTAVSSGDRGTWNGTVKEQAAFLDPTWHLTTVPASTESAADQQAIEDWFERKAREGVSTEVEGALGLKEPMPL